jgi:signal transduction histidine kinase
LGIVSLISLWLARSILLPLEAMRRAAAGIAGGDLSQRVVTGRNDELGELAGAFNSMTGRLQHTLQQQRDFVANASHELRTPLTTIRLRVEALLGGARNDPVMANRFLDEIDSELERLNRLVDELLSLSRAEAGAEVLRKERVNLSRLLSRAVASFEPRAQAAGITLSLDAAPEVPAVAASPAHIRQVIDNLLDNALKYSAGGGVIAISCRGVEDRVVVAVTDTGQGIPARDLPHVFERFYRADRARSRGSRARGSGLGLSIVRSVISAHGGEVSIDSQEGKGTSVRFTLPVWAST